MSVNPDGTGTCDGCGNPLPNTGVLYAVTVSGMDVSGEAVRLHLCTGQPAPCARRVLNRTALHHLDFIGAVPVWHSEDLPEASPDPEEST
jgi:hypothetical protein